MSGIKGATVRNNLNKVVNTVRSGIAECERAADEAQAVGRSDFNRVSGAAERIHSGVKRQLPADVREFLSGETAQWEALLRDHDERFKQGRDAAADAGERMAEFQRRKQNSERQLADIGHGVDNVRRALQGKDWYCEAENAEAKRLRAAAEGVLAGMRKDVRLGREAQALQRESLTAFAESSRLAVEADREYERLVNLGHERQERQRIKEENERKAKNLQSDLESLRKTIESKNIAKFGGTVYTPSERHECEEIVRLIGNGRFESAIPRAEALLPKLRRAAAAIDAAQRAWETEKLAAERLVSDAREETSKIDRSNLEAFSGESAEAVSACYKAIDSAQENLRHEDFAKVRDAVGPAVEKLRNLKEKAESNRRLAEAREEMAQAIMQALYDANFDTPQYFMNDEADELSDLCIVAAAPGGVGDMKLRINMAGETQFEVCNIPEGHEKLCVDQIRSLQRGLAEQDIRFDMTNWGRAEKQGREHLDLRQKTQQVQKTVQRQG